jgi:hypothetical protein
MYSSCCRSLSHPHPSAVNRHLDLPNQLTYKETEAKGDNGVTFTWTPIFGTMASFMVHGGPEGRCVPSSSDCFTRTFLSCYFIKLA